jgi:hypothetical protein
MMAETDVYMASRSIPLRAVDNPGFSGQIRAIKKPAFAGEISSRREKFTESEKLVMVNRDETYIELATHLSPR